MYVQCISYLNSQEQNTIICLTLFLALNSPLYRGTYATVAYFCNILHSTDSKIKNIPPVHVPLSNTSLMSQSQSGKTIKMPLTVHLSYHGTVHELDYNALYIIRADTVRRLVEKYNLTG